MSNIILCADDSKTMQMVAEITFRVSDYQYIGASSAEDALTKAKEQKPLLILADAIMPGKTGYDLCKLVKGEPALAGVPVVVLCGNSAPYDSSKGSAAGADGHLTKPWDTQVMLDKIAELLDKFQSSGVAKAPAASAAASKPPVKPPAAEPKVSPKPPILPKQPGAGRPPAPSAAAKDDAARTATLMGMPSVLPPAMVKSMARGSDLLGSARPLEAKPSPAPKIPPPPGMRRTPPVSPAVPKPAPASLRPAGTEAPETTLPGLGRSERPRPAIPPPPKYAAPSGKAVITKPGIPEGPRPADSRSAPPAAASKQARPPAAKRVDIGLGPSGNVGIDRPPMIRGVPTRRPSMSHSAVTPANATPAAAPARLSANIAAATNAAAANVAMDAGLDPNGPEMKALLALSKDVVERVVWEVVPDLAEQIIRENLDQLTKR